MAPQLISLEDFKAKLKERKDQADIQKWLDKVNDVLHTEFKSPNLIATREDFKVYGLNCHPKNAALDIYNRQHLI